MQNEIVLLRISNSMLKSSVEILTNDLEEVKAACQFLIKKKKGTTERNTCKVSVGGTWCNQTPENLHLCKMMRTQKEILGQSLVSTLTV